MINHTGRNLYLILNNNNVLINFIILFHHTRIHDIRDSSPTEHNTPNIPPPPTRKNIINNNLHIRNYKHHTSYKIFTLQNITYMNFQKQTDP
jgi:hypothetical protein